MGNPGAHFGKTIAMARCHLGDNVKPIGVMIFILWLKRFSFSSAAVNRIFLQRSIMRILFMGVLLKSRQFGERISRTRNHGRVGANLA